MKRSYLAAAVAALVVVCSLAVWAASSNPAITVVIPADFRGTVAIRAQGGAMKIDGQAYPAGEQGVYLWEKTYSTQHDAVTVQLTAPLWFNYWFHFS